MLKNVGLRFFHEKLRSDPFNAMRPYLNIFTMGSYGKRSKGMVLELAQKICKYGRAELNLHSAV